MNIENATISINGKQLGEVTSLKIELEDTRKPLLTEKTVKIEPTEKTEKWLFKKRLEILSHKSLFLGEKR